MSGCYGPFAEDNYYENQLLNQEPDDCPECGAFVNSEGYCEECDYEKPEM